MTAYWYGLWILDSSFLYLTIIVRGVSNKYCLLFFFHCYCFLLFETNRSRMNSDQSYHCPFTYFYILASIKKFTAFIPINVRNDFCLYHRRKDLFSDKTSVRLQDVFPRSASSAEDHTRGCFTETFYRNGLYSRKKVLSLPCRSLKPYLHCIGLDLSMGSYACSMSS